AMREKGFISYDPDIDLGVVADELPADIHERMEAAGFHLQRRNYIREPYQVVEETYIYRNLHLDIFFCIEEGDDWYIVTALPHETKEWKEANATDGFPTIRGYIPKTDFERIDFLGIRVWVPVKAHEWLCALYSDSYMTPIKNWNRKDYITRIVDAPDRAYRQYFD
ncbi:MAG: hypothetical protein HUJ94_07105, partial [Bacteroidales bacterium]|nr:hypothetical protein [Bacteroidales bacterium]